VTLTLPEDVVAALHAVDPDLSRAVVRVAQAGIKGAPHRAAELSTFGRRSVIVVRPSRTLEKRTGILLVPLPDGRALISFERSMTPARLELLLEDALEGDELGREDARVFADIAGIMKDARRSQAVRVYERSIIVLESDRTAKHKGAPRRPRASR
jgi:hypothetical protein